MPPSVPPGPIVRLPLTFIVLLFMTKVPPGTDTFVGASVLPALFVQVPPWLTSMSPPMVVFVPLTLTSADVDTLLPPRVAVFPDIVILGLVPSNSRLAPPTKIAPPRLPTELLVKLVVATVVGNDSTTMPPPLAVGAELFENVEVPNDALPVPVPPGAANAKMYRSAPPPPAAPELATLRVNVVPVTVRVPVPPMCCGEDGV